MKNIILCLGLFSFFSVYASDQIIQKQGIAPTVKEAVDASIYQVISTEPSFVRFKDMKNFIQKEVYSRNNIVRSYRIVSKAAGNVHVEADIDVDALNDAFSFTGPFLFNLPSVNYGLYVVNKTKDCKRNCKNRQYFEDVLKERMTSKMSLRQFTLSEYFSDTSISGVPAFDSFISKFKRENKIIARALIEEAGKVDVEKRKIRLFLVFFDSISKSEISSIKCTFSEDDAVTGLDSCIGDAFSRAGKKIEDAVKVDSGNSVSLMLTGANNPEEVENILAAIRRKAGRDISSIVIKKFSKDFMLYSMDTKLDPQVLLAMIKAPEFEASLNDRIITLSLLRKKQ